MERNKPLNIFYECFNTGLCRCFTLTQLLLSNPLTSLVFKSWKGFHSNDPTGTTSLLFAIWSVNGEIRHGHCSSSSSPSWSRTSPRCKPFSRSRVAELSQLLLQTGQKGVGGFLPYRLKSTEYAQQPTGIRTTQILFQIDLLSLFSFYW